MSKYNTKASSWIRSLIYTSIICTVIAFVTQAIWHNSIVDHLMISFGFGYSAVFSDFALSVIRPQLTSMKVHVISLTVSMILGTANAYFLLNKYDLYSDSDQLKPIIFLGFIFTTACFFYFHNLEQKAVVQKELETAKRKQSEQEKALILSQLKQLQSQIEPHFLFNTLANINALIDQDPKNARLMLEKLTDLLRETLKISRESSTSLQAELSQIDSYLAIQKIRLGERLHYTINCYLTEPMYLPPLLLQPLVENAIGHGIEPQSGGGEVVVNVKKQQDALILEVIDNGVGLNHLSNHIGHGVGLDNIRQRLQALFGQQASLTISERPSGGVKSLLSIPLVGLNRLQEKSNDET